MSGNGRKLPLLTKVSFGVGAVGELFYLGMFNTFAGIYYNQAIGLSNSLIGTAIMLALIVDAVSDPLMGMISDGWRSKMGRRHPFLFAAPIPLAISIYLIFNPPASIVQAAGEDGSSSQWLLFAWLAGFTILSRLSITLYSVPHLALGGELTRDHDERSRLFSLNAIFGYAMGALFAFSAWGWFLAGETVNGLGETVPRHLDAASYQPLVLTACGIVLVSIWLSAIGTLNQVAHLSQPVDEQRRISLGSFYRELIGLFRNRNYAWLIGGAFFFMIATGLFETFNVFVNTFFWEFETEQIKWFGLFAAPSAIVGAVLSPILMRRFDRKPVLIGGLLMLTVSSQLAVDLRLLGVMPENGSAALLPIVVGIASVLTMSISAAAVAILSMLGDVIDENELATGKRQEGLYFSARALVTKGSVSLGHLFAGVILDLFIVLPFNAVPGQVDADIVVRLGVAAGPVMGIFALISLLFYAQYHLPKARHREVCEKLDARALGPQDSRPEKEPAA